MDEESRFYKIDDAIQRLATVSADLSKMLAVHEQRLDTQEKAAVNLSASLEKRRDEVDAKFKELKDYFEKIFSNMEKDYSNVKVKIEVLQKYIWMAAGALALSSWLGNPILNKLIFK